MLIYNSNKRILFLIVTLSLVFRIVKCRAEPEAKPGLLGGLAGGALGSVIGHTLFHKSDDHQHHHTYHATTIDRLETFINGCYRQVVREPDSHNTDDYIETEQMLCPINVQPPIIGTMPLQPPSLTAGPDPQQVFVLSRRSGTYRNSSSSLMASSLFALLVFTSLSHFM
uniref:Glycine zipper 2TM domain-containing protein n=1 Tax=Stomoxys calcitrans TaxID=35570 RepID=A0A1I8Q2C0_STOCA